MTQDYKYLYGLGPADFTLGQIRKIPSYVLWKHIKDVRFEDELLSRIKKISDIRTEIELYTAYTQEDITSSPRLIQLINKLAPKEKKYSVLQPYFNVLNDKNKKHAMNLFLEDGRNELSYERFISVIVDRYKYIDADNKHLIKIIFELLEESRIRPIVLYLLGHLSKEKFDKIYPIVKEKAKNSIIGHLLYYTSYVPEEDHLFVLKAMSKITGVRNIKDDQFKTKINPQLLKKLSLSARLHVLKNMSLLKAYPFTHRVSGNFIKNLLFPYVFKRSSEVEMVLKNWEYIEKIASQDLPICELY